MKRNVFLIMLLVFIIMAGAEEIERLQKRKDICSGYADSSEESAFNELVRSIVNWQLEEGELYSQLSLSKKETLVKLTEIWLEDFPVRKAMKGEKILYYLSNEEVDKYYQELQEEIVEMIRQAEEYAVVNKLGLAMRNYYSALVLSDLIPGLELTVNEQDWNREKLIDTISKIVENVFLKLRVNEYHLGRRRLLFHALYENRPVNDLRLSVINEDKVQSYSLQDRFLEIELFGNEFADYESIYLKIDLQDRLSHALDRRIIKLGQVTGMDAFEAYRTIPLPSKKENFVYWDELKLPELADSISTKQVHKCLRGLLENIEFGEERNQDIFASEGIRLETNALLTGLQIRNLDVNSGIMVEETPMFRLWRGFKVSIAFQNKLLADCNLVIKTDRTNRINGVWLGMKPLDYRLLKRNRQSEDITQFLMIIENIEKNFTRHLLGRISPEFNGSPVYPPEGWFWAELEKIEIIYAENEIIYKYVILLSGKDEFWKHAFTGVSGG